VIGLHQRSTVALHTGVGDARGDTQICATLKNMKAQIYKVPGTNGVKAAFVIDEANVVKACVMLRKGASEAEEQAAIAKAEALAAGEASQPGIELVKSPIKGGK